VIQTFLNSNGSRSVSLAQTFTTQKRNGQQKNHRTFSPPPGDEVPARRVNRDDLYHFYASLFRIRSIVSPLC